MANIVLQINKLRKSSIKKVIDSRIKEFKSVVPVKTGIQKGKKAGFPRIKCGAGSVKHEMTISKDIR